MATYAIGDIQGCFNELQALLKHIHFQPEQDVLWFTGDLVNRGSQSLETLRFIYELGDQHQTVLGNHDLHLLAVANGAAKLKQHDTFDAILKAPDCDLLINWLKKQPLLHYDPHLNFVLVHAGLAPSWDLTQAISLAAEVSAALQESPVSFLSQMYGDFPRQWQDELKGIDRLRCITNYFTRLRFCDREGNLRMDYKGSLENKPAPLIPWFEFPHRKNHQLNIIFGHWAALNGHTATPHLYPLDTGCIWGNQLTALRLEDKKAFHIACRSHTKNW